MNGLSRNARQIVHFRKSMIKLLEQPDGGMFINSPVIVMQGVTDPRTRRKEPLRRNLPSQGQRLFGPVQQ